MKRYFKDNVKVFRFLNNKRYKVLEIKPIRKIRGNFKEEHYIVSYCVTYEKVL